MDELKHKHWWLYVLKLDKGKYYVGITSKAVEERFWEHKHKVRAAYWTMKYEPISIELSEDLGTVSKQYAEEYEDKVTRSLMKERGVNNVRGGDLRDTEEYIIRFGYIFDKEKWKDLIFLALLLILFAAFYIDKYFVVFIPGGVR